MTYNPAAIANYFLDRAEKAGEALSHMKLQKLVYYAHGWHLAIFNQPLINEQIEAWQFGPVIPSLYETFKHNGSREIEEKAFDWLELEHYSVDENDKQLMSFLSEVWTVYKKYTAGQLSNMTHEEGSPWQLVVANGNVASRSDIPENIIKQYFNNKKNANTSAA